MKIKQIKLSAIILYVLNKNFFHQTSFVQSACYSVFTPLLCCGSNKLDKICGVRSQIN